MPKIDLDRLREPAVWVLLVTAGVNTLLSFLGGIIVGGGLTVGGVSPVTMAMAVGAVWLAVKPAPTLKNAQVIAYGALGTLALAVLAILIKIVRGLADGGSPLAPGSGFFAVQDALTGLLYIGVAVIAGLYVMNIAGIELPERRPKPVPAAGALPPGPYQQGVYQQAQHQQAQHQQAQHQQAQHQQAQHQQGAYQQGAYQQGAYQQGGWNQQQYGQPPPYQQQQSYAHAGSYEQPGYHEQPGPYDQPRGGQETEALDTEAINTGAIEAEARSGGPLESFMREAPSAPDQRPTGDLLSGDTGAFTPPPDTFGGAPPGSFGADPRQPHAEAPQPHPGPQQPHPAPEQPYPAAHQPPARAAEDEPITGRPVPPSEQPVPPAEMTVDLNSLGLQHPGDEAPPEEWHGPQRP